MKKMYRKEEGVSPVIATILMVAITVVLAATVYIMVSGILGGGGSAPVSGSLTYLSQYSTTSNATFQISLSNPTNPKVSDLSVKVLNTDGKVVSGSSFGVIHINSDPTHVKSGDHIYVTLSSGSFESGYQVIISIAGYSGTITGNIP